MADILLTHGYVLQEDEKEQAIMRPYPPLGLLYVSAYLKRAGFGVDVYDSTLGSREALFARVATGPAVVGVYTNLMTRAAVVDIAAHARRHGRTVVLGGPESANHPAEYLAHGADVIVVGEGEATLTELLPALAARGRHRLHGVAGTVFLDETGEMVTNPAREQVASLDSLPWPDRDAIDLPAYVDIWRRHHGAGSVNLITARGCPYRCDWCSHAVFGHTHRRRSVVDCANELEWIRDRYRPDQVWYADDVFTIHHGWLHAYRAELDRRGLRLPFETISRADRLMRDEVFDALAALGCHRIWIGAESGSQRLLDAMQRGVTREQIVWASRAARRHGIEVGMFLMWGYHGETVADIEQTIDLVKQADPDIFFTTVSYPIKGTGYYAKVADRVSLPKPWTMASDRDYVIAGRRDRDYYRQVDAWLRHEVAAFRLERQDAHAAAAERGMAAEAREAVCAGAPVTS